MKVMKNRKLSVRLVPSFFVRATKKEAKKALRRQSLSGLRPSGYGRRATRPWPPRRPLQGFRVDSSANPAPLRGKGAVQGLPLHPPWRRCPPDWCENNIDARRQALPAWSATFRGKGGSWRENRRFYLHAF